MRRRRHNVESEIEGDIHRLTAYDFLILVIDALITAHLFRFGTIKTAPLAVSIVVTIKLRIIAFDSRLASYRIYNAL